MSEVYLYTVNPKKAIIGLSGTKKPIRSSKSLYLTKEDVYACLKNGTVYRRFANEGINERVTVNDVDRVHRENYISEKDWPAFLAKQKSVNHATISSTAPVVEKNEEKDKVEEKKETTEEVIVSDDDPVVEKVEEK